MNLPPYILEYLPVFIFIGFSGGMALAITVANFIVSKQRPYKNKLAAYECGFDAFDDARDKFDVRFYLVAILFTLFDLEIAFLFPWGISLTGIGAFGYWSMVGFLSILTVGFLYEWKKGALEWE